MNGLALPVDYEAFLARYWQREALFIANGLPGFLPPLSADELAGIALEPEADARLVLQRGNSWGQQRGPFTEQDFQRDGAWSLLVQEVDQYSEEAAELLDILPFIPRWRINDVLMSYATEGGSAGPHFDRYDVFIIQGEGERRWRIGQRCDGETALQANEELQILADFQTVETHVMRCGDVLYIPPGVAHWGESLGESTSFSVGLRAPSMRDLLARWVDNRLDAMDPGALFADPRREAAVHAGEITAHDMDRARRQLQALFNFDDPDWFGEVITESLGADGADHAAPNRDCVLALTPGERLAWLRRDNALCVFAAGQSRHSAISAKALLEAFCQGERVAMREYALFDDHAALLQWLLERGTLQCHEH